MTLLRLALNLGVLLAILSLLVDAHNPWEISLKAREPHRHFDTKRLPASAGPFPDSRIHQVDLKRDPIPLGGGIGTLGTYYCEITVAGQNFRVVVDTGSSILYIPTTDCTLNSGPDAGATCFSFSPPLNLASAPVDPIPCSDTGCSCTTQSRCAISTTFGDGSSVSGIGYTATVSVGNLTANDASFAAMTSASGDFVNDRGTQLDGLWGLGYQIYRGGQLIVIPTVIDSIFDQNPSLQRVISMRLDETGGSMVIGSVDKSSIVGPLEYTPIIETGWYVIHNPRMAVGDSSTSLTEVDFDPGSVTSIVDSGATLIIAPLTYWNALRQAMINTAGCPPHMCDEQSIFDPRRFCYPNFPFDQYPTIAFLLPPVNDTSPTIQLILDPRQYMVNTTDTQGNKCVAFGIAPSGGDFFILGDTFMTQFFTVFDRQNAQIGFSARVQHAEPPAEPFVPTGTASPTSLANSVRALSFEAKFIIVSVCLVWIVIQLFLG